MPDLSTPAAVLAVPKHTPAVDRHSAQVKTAVQLSLTSVGDCSSRPDLALQRLLLLASVGSCRHVSHRRVYCILYSVHAYTHSTVLSTALHGKDLKLGSPVTGLEGVSTLV